MESHTARWNLTLLWMISGLHKGDAVIFCCAHLLIMQISADQHFMQPRSNNMSSLDSGRGSHNESCAGLCHSAGLLTHVFSPLHHFPRQLMRDGHLFVVCLLCQAKLITSSSCLLIKEKKFWSAANLMLLMEFGCIDNEACCSVKLIIRWSKERPNLAAVLTNLEFSTQSDALVC